MKKNIAAHPETGQRLKDAPALFSAASRPTKEKIVEARKRLAAAIGPGGAIWNHVRQKAGAGAKVTDKMVRDHPNQFISLILGVGALMGHLRGRRNC